MAVIDGRGFHEVYRTVPVPDEGGSITRYKHQSWSTSANGIVELPAIDNIPATADMRKGLSEFAGGEFSVGLPNHPMVPQHRRTIAPFLSAPLEVTVSEYRRVMNSTPTAHREKSKLKADLDPITFVSYSAALEYAELVGMRLPTEFEYEFAATAGGTAPISVGRRYKQDHELALRPGQESRI